MCLKYNTIQVDWNKLDDLYRNKPDSKTKYEEAVNKVFVPFDNSGLDKILLYKKNELYSDDNNENKIIAKKSATFGEVDFYIMFVPMQALKNHYFYVALTNSKYRIFNDKTKDNYSPKPIIFVTVFNVFNDFHNTIVKDNKKARLSEEDYFKSQEQDLKNRIKYFNLDKRKGFLDNSIWHFYLPFQDYSFYNYKNSNGNFKPVHFKIRLSHAVSVINKTKKLKLYDATVSKENLEFQLRLMKNSYLDDIGGDHAKHITPFVFHSEGEMFHRANYKIHNLVEELKLPKREKIKWNILLLDDYAEFNLNGTGVESDDITGIALDVITELRGYKKIEEKEFNTFKENFKEIIFVKSFIKKIYEDNSVLGFIKNEIVKRKKNIDGNNKYNIVKGILDEIKSSSKDKFDFELIGTKKRYGEKTYIDTFKREINKDKFTYDIILLDYLLDDKDSTERILGSDLFTNPENRQFLNQNSKKLLGKFWFLPISSFNNAMLDKISNEGIGRVTKDWFLFDGADVVSTPELFKYNLIKLMELQLNQALVTKEEIIDDFLGSEEFKEYKNTIGIRQLARMKYGEFMHKFGLKEFLKYDKDKKSAFAESIVELSELGYEKDNLCYQETRKLIYLLGFGTKHHNNELWETFTRVRNMANAIEVKNDGIKKANLGVLSTYINSLK